METDDTIVAIATPMGVGGVGVIRLSGERALTIAERLLEEKPQEIKPRIVYHGWIMDADEVMYAYMKSPKSYTGEDVVEVNCHGGAAVLKKILKMCIEAGARPARPGEFTKRAFLNGRMDLAQAEAVLEIIQARTDKGVEVAAKQLGGGLSNETKRIREEIFNILIKIEAAIDFPEETEEPRMLEIWDEINTIKNEIEKLEKTASYGKALKEGVKAAIIGKPNVGKSSLLNRLTEDDRAIVDESPGTTRDTIEEVINIEGVPVVLVDTAGIRMPTGEVEGKGIKRAKEAAKEAEVVLLVLDASSAQMSGEDKEAIAAAEGKRIIWILNKVDLGKRLNEEGIEISCKTGEGIGGLKKKIYDIIIGEENRPNGRPILITERHYNCTRRAWEALERALRERRTKSIELIAADLKEAIEAMDEIKGKRMSDEIIEKIFAKFCIGK